LSFPPFSTGFFFGGELLYSLGGGEALIVYSPEEMAAGFAVTLLKGFFVAMLLCSAIFFGDFQLEFFR
jgi:hypothetical protein